MEGPAIAEAWFRMVRATMDQYAILDDDTYNFDETGFQMGVISTEIVTTGSERRGRAKTSQPGNREWVTVIQGVNERALLGNPVIHYLCRSTPPLSLVRKRRYTTPVEYVN
jgi:hypothetical protein